MAKHAPKQDLESLKRRIAKLRADGHFEEALRLSRNLAREHPTAGHADLLRDIILQRASHLFGQGKFDEAAAALRVAALESDAPPDYLAKVAERLAECGDLPQALALLPRVAEPEKLRANLVGRVVDFAIQQGAAGRAKLPADLHAGFDAILHAFRHAEAGRDDEARAALQPIGLQSPFLDWKMLLRGLLAYYARDDARAIENWSRLDRTRLSFRLAGSLWVSIDPVFSASLPPLVRKELQARSGQLLGGKIEKLFQEVRSSIGKPSLAAAFVAADKLVAALKQEAPHLIPRVADCFRWLIVDHGHPDDLDRYVRVFGYPADDPTLHKLMAIALEKNGLTHDANAAWQAFLGDLAEHNFLNYSAEQQNRVKALVWRRMGDNAFREGDDPKSQGQGFGGSQHQRKSPSKPSAVECYTKCIKLAPDLIDVRLQLLDIYRLALNFDKAKKVALELLKQFPEHGKTLEDLGDMYRIENDPARAVAMYARALQANPLERRLRRKLSNVRRIFALHLTLENKIDDARKQLDLALESWDGPRCPVLCQGVVIEMKASRDSGEGELFQETSPSNRKRELLEQIHAVPHQRLAAAFTLAAEAIRVKLPRSTEKQLGDTLKAELAQPATLDEIIVLLEAAALHRESHAKTIKGQQALERSFGKLFEKIDPAELSETQLERLCRQLGILQLRTIWKKTLAAASKRYPSNANIALARLDCELAAPRGSRGLWYAKDQLEKVRKLVNKMPRGEVQGQLHDEIKLREEQIRKIEAQRRLNSFDLFERLFDSFGDDEEDKS